MLLLAVFRMRTEGCAFVFPLKFYQIHKLKDDLKRKFLLLQKDGTVE